MPVRLLPSAEPFYQPPPPLGDLRAMLRRRIVATALDQLDAAAAERGRPLLSLRQMVLCLRWLDPTAVARAVRVLFELFPEETEAVAARPDNKLRWPRKRAGTKQNRIDTPSFHPHFEQNIPEAAP